MQSRRQFLATTALAGTALAFSQEARAQQAFDALRLFIPAAPGGGWDGTGRSIESVCRAAGLVGTFQLEHAPGAGGAVGLPRFLNQYRGQANSLMVAGMVMVGALLTNRSPVSLVTTVPIARLTEEALAVVVPAASPHRDMRGLAAAIRANPGGVPIAGGSAGGTDHILLGLIGRTLGVQPRSMSYVAFAGGGEAIAAIIGNQVQAGISGYSEFEEQIRGGRMRALAVSSAARLPGVDVPTLREQGIDVELANWRGVFGAPGINEAQRNALIQLMTRMNASPQWQAELRTKGWTGVFLPGDAYKTYVEREFERIGLILRELGLVT